MTFFNDTQLSFGRYLRDHRKTKKLSLEAIAGELKIGMDVLQAIENEDLSKMPDKVFAKGFLRGFAKSVDADENRVIYDYLKMLHQFNRSIQASHNLDRENDLFWRKLVVSIIVLLCVIFVTIFVLSGSEDEMPIKEQTKGLTDSVSSSCAGGPAVSRDTPGKVSSPETIPEKIRLSVYTLEETWIKIIIDSEKAKEYTLQPGDRLELEACNKYNLLVGNAAGVKLFANRIPIDLPGEKNKVVNIEIP